MTMPTKEQREIMVREIMDLFDDFEDRFGLPRLHLVAAAIGVLNAEMASAVGIPNAIRILEQGLCEMGWIERKH